MMKIKVNFSKPEQFYPDDGLKQLRQRSELGGSGRCICTNKHFETLERV